MDFLSQILTSRRAAVDAAKASTGEPTLRHRAAARGAPRDFHAALAAPGMSVIAEFKRASPSRGVLRADLDPRRQARAYEQGGARAMSVLTEPDWFKGSALDLALARSACDLPVLWKDFILEPYQVVEARAWGADAVLLIVRILDDAMLLTLIDEIHEWGMAALVEIFDEEDLGRAVAAGARIIGVNHRDLATFEEDPGATVRLRPLFPQGVLSVGESAISSRADVKSLINASVDAALVGEALVRSDDPAATLRGMLS